MQASPTDLPSRALPPLTAIEEAAIDSLGRILAAGFPAVVFGRQERDDGVVVPTFTSDLVEHWGLYLEPLDDGPLWRAGDLETGATLATAPSLQAAATAAERVYRAMLAERSYTVLEDQPYEA